MVDRMWLGIRLHIHASVGMVWVVQALIEGGRRRMVIARRGEMELAEAPHRARCWSASGRTGPPPPAHAGQDRAHGRRPRRRGSAPVRPSRKPSGDKTRPWASISKLVSCRRSARWRATASVPWKKLFGSTTPRAATGKMLGHRRLCAPRRRSFGRARRACRLHHRRGDGDRPRRDRPVTVSA